MLQHLDPVPFTIENEAHLGLSETQGLLSCDGENLLIEYRTVDTILGALKTPSKTLAIPLDELQSIRCQHKLFGTRVRVIIRTRSQKALEALPDAKAGMITAALKRHDRLAAEEFCLAVQGAVSRRRGLRIGDDLDALEKM